MRTFEEIWELLDSAVLNEDLEELRRVIEECEILGSPQSEATGVFAQGLFASFEGRYADALEYYQRSIVLFRAVRYRAGEARAHMNIGLDQMITRDDASALEVSNRALSINQEIGDISGEARILGNVESGMGAPRWKGALV